jgi:6-phosphogluconolactonase
MIEEIVITDRRAAADRAATLIETNVLRLLSQQESTVLAVPGGRSVVDVFVSLAQKELPWQRIHLFMVDERLVPLGDPESNYQVVTNNLLDPLLEQGKLVRENIHPFYYQPEKQDAGIGDYEEELVRHGGKFDLILLGAGEDGHVAALYPDHHSIHDNGPFFITFTDSPKPPPERMSATKTLLSMAETGIVLFFGNEKRAAYQKFRDTDVPVHSCPAKLVYALRQSFLVTDIATEKSESGNPE